jgi:hypothetical protein
VSSGKTLLAISQEIASEWPSLCFLLDDFHLNIGRLIAGGSEGRYFTATGREGNNTMFSASFLKGTTLSNDKDYFLLTEFRFLLKSMAFTSYAELSDSFARSDLKYGGDSSSSSGASPLWTKRLVDREQTAKRWTFLQDLHQRLEAWSAQMLERARSANGWRPRVLRLAEIYKLSPTETELFNLLVVLQGTQTPTARLQMIEDDAARRAALCARLCNMNEIDVDDFQNESRKHVGDGTLIVEESDYVGCKTMRLSAIGVRILLGRTLTDEQKLKVSQTELERLLDEEAGHAVKGGADGSDSASNNTDSGSESPSLKRPRVNLEISNGKVQFQEAGATAASPVAGLEATTTSLSSEPPLKTIMEGISQQTKNPGDAKQQQSSSSRFLSTCCHHWCCDFGRLTFGAPAIYGRLPSFCPVLYSACLSCRPCWCCFLSAHTH